MNITAALAVSLHLLPGDWNAIHPSISVEQGGWALGAMLNSESRLSVVGGYQWQDGPLWAELGLATGYSAAPVVPFLRAGIEHDGVRFFVAPAATKKDVGLVLGVELNLGD